MAHMDCSVYEPAYEVWGLGFSQALDYEPEILSPQVSSFRV